ncbi:MAG: SpoIIE family protein phosphatase [Mogibacterium sp.]|nr:SpoIIE family protein phosphatase [Mogibacterium sp.]
MKLQYKLSKGMKRYVWLIMSLLLALFLMTQTAVAADTDAVEPSVDPIRYNDNYSAVVYDNTNGLPASEANTIVQTSEGFIWIGCYAGLVRYDGNTFERLDSTQGVNSISSLYVDKQDRLWIGTNDNGVAVMENGKFRFWDEKDGLGASKINDIEGDDDGCVYVGTTAGISMFKPDLEMTSLNDERIDDVYVESMVSGSNGLLYGTSHDGNVFILRDGNLVNYYEKDETMHPITCVYPDPKKPGWIYYGTEDEGVFHVNLKSGFKTADHIDISPLVGVYDISQLGDYIWICTRNGAGAIGEDGFHSLDYLPLNNSVDHVMMDYEGNLWFTSSRQGVMKLVANRFTDIFARYGLEEDVVNTTCMLGGKLFIGSDTGLTVTDENGVVDSFPLNSVRAADGGPLNEGQNGSDLLKMLDGIRIRSIIRDSKDRLWISTWKSLGLLRYDHGELTVFDESDGLLSNRIRSVYETKDGRILVAITGGLNIIKNDKVVVICDKDNGIANNETLNVCEAPNGDVLVGSNGDGIYVVNDKGTSNIGRDAGLTSGVIMRIKYDEKNKVFWIVTGNSLAYMTENYKLTTISKFPYPDNFDTFINSKGDMWILSSDGIYVAPVKELLADKATNPVHYGIANGIPCITTSNPYNYLTEDGDLYIAGRSGVAMVNIEESLEDINDLKLSVPYVKADSKMIYPDNKGRFNIPASTKKLAVYAYVYNYSLTDPLVAFQLRGFERRPSTVRRSDLGPIYYTNLQGGTYRFDMQVMDAMGRSSKTMTATIMKARAFYEQPWFFVLALLLFGGGALVLLQLYVRDKLKKIEKQHRERAERERITSDLHMANQIQTSVLPHEFPPFPERKEFELFAMMEPAREVGGDFYDFFLIDDDHLCLVMADVSGKGIPASLFMMNSKVLIKSFASGDNSPAEVLAKANREICENNQMEMFVTVWLGILELSTGKIVASNAGHEYPVIGRCGGKFELIKDKHGFVVGGMDGVKYTDYELQLQPGDKLFVYTDGVPEATNTKDELFGTDRMLEALNADSYAPVEELLRNVRKAISEYTAGAEQFDDLTMLAVEYLGNILE